MDWNLIRQHVANTTVEERNAKRQEVSSDDVEVFVENYGKVSSGVANSAGSNSYVSSAERTANSNALDALERRRKRAQEYLEKKSGDYKNGDELLSDITNSANDIEVLKRTNTAVNDYWNQWSSESDYNDYFDYVKEQERLAHLNIKEARDKKYALEQERDNLGQDIKQEVGKVGTAGIVASSWAGKNQNAYYGLSSEETNQRRLELEREIQALDKDINLASRIQQANFEKNFALEAPDFEEYSLAGKNIRNDLAEQASNVYTHEAFSKNYRNPNVIDQTVRFMNGEQRQIYDYYLGKYGKERADEYLYTIADDVNMRRAEAIYEGSEDNIAYQTLLTLASGIEQWSEGSKSAAQMLMGNDEYRPQGSIQYAAGNVREELADVGVLPEWMTNIVGDTSLGQMAFDLTQTTANMLPYIVLGHLGGGIVGSVSLGLSASGNAYQEMIKEGYNKEQASSYAALVGASETLLEHVLGGIGALGGKLGKAATAKLLTHIDNALARVAVNLAAKGVSEFTEEYLQEILDPFFRNMALMEENEIKLVTPEAIYAGILGALSAGILEGGSVIGGEVQYQKADKALAEKYSALAGEAIENGLQRAEGSDMRKLAEAAQKKQEKGKDLSGRQMQELVLGEDKARISEAAENRLKTLGETKDTAVVAKAIQKTVTGEDLSAKERVALNHSTYGKRVLNELDPFNILSESTSSAWTKDIGTREIGKDFYSRPKVEAKATETEAQKAEEAKPVDVVEEAFKKSGIRIGSVGISSKDTVREVLSNVEGITSEAAEKLANVYEEEGGGVSANEFIRKTAKAFNIGYLNTPVESVKAVFSNSSVSPSAMMRAYYIGSETFAKKHKGEALTSQATTIKGVKGKVVFEKGVDRDKLKPQQRVAVEVMEKVLADATNVEFHIFESYVRDGKRYYIDEFGVEQKKAPNGKFIGNVHQIWIDINAGGKGEGTMLFTLFHELTHNIHVWSPEHFNTLAKITAEAFAKGGYSFEDAVNSKMAQYAKYENYTRDNCIEEVIAEAMSGLGYDGKVIEDIANQVKAQDKTLWQKIVDWLGSIVDRIKKAYAQLSPSAPEAKILMQQKELFEQAQKVFAEAVVESGRAYRAAETVTEGAFKGLEKVTEGDSDIYQTKDGSVIAIAEKGNVNNVKYNIGEYKNGGKDILVKWLNSTDKKTGERIVDKKTRDQILNSMNYAVEIVEALEKNIPIFKEWGEVGITFDDSGKPVMRCRVKNGDYEINFDFSTVCKKRKALDAVLNNLVKTGKINLLDLSKSDIQFINDTLNSPKYGFEIACGLCFVDSKRYRVGEWASNAASMYNDIVQSLVKPEDINKIMDFNFGGDKSRTVIEGDISTWDDSLLDFSTIDNILATESNAEGMGYRKAFAKLIKNNPKYRKLLLSSDIISSAGSDKMRNEASDLLAAVNAVGGTSKPKMSFSESIYDHSVILDTRVDKETAFAMGGARTQSFSDFIATMFFDYCQMFAEAAGKGLPMQAYTKELSFAKLFGLTGVRINLSVLHGVNISAEDRAWLDSMYKYDKDGKLVLKIGKGKKNLERYNRIRENAGLDANGNYVYEQQSIDFDEAVKLQTTNGYSRFLGTIVVGISEKHIWKLLDDAKVRMIIPYHKSGLSAVIAKARNIDCYNDFTKHQNTRFGESWGKDAGKTKSSKELLKTTKERLAQMKENGEEWDFYSVLHAYEKEWDTNTNSWKKGTGHADTITYEMDSNGVNTFRNDPMRQTCEDYLAWCEKFDMIPQFEQFIKHPNYYKMQEDFDVYDCITGEYVPQTAIKFKLPSIKNGDAFNAQDVLEAELDEQQRTSDKLNKKMPEITKEIIDTIGKKIPPEIKVGKSMMQDRDSDVDIDAQVNMTRAWIDNIENRLSDPFFAEENPKVANELRAKLESLYRDLRGELAEVRKQTKKTSLKTILENLEYYSDLDIEGLANDISENNWDFKEEGLSRAEIIEGIREMLEEKMEDMSPLEQQSPKFGFYVRPVNKSEDIRYSDRDSKYMEAVKKADIGTMQKLVEEAAKEAGYTEKLYHGTNQYGFTKADVSKSDDKISFFATDSEEVAQTYSGVGGTRWIADNSLSEESIDKAYDEAEKNVNDCVDDLFRAVEHQLPYTIDFSGLSNYAEELADRLFMNEISDSEVDENLYDYIAENVHRSWTYARDNYGEYEDYDGYLDWVESEEAEKIWDATDKLTQAILNYVKARNMTGLEDIGNYELYANVENLFEIDAKGKAWNQIPFDEYDTNGFHPRVTTRELAAYAKNEGYKGVKITNVYDDGGRGKYQTKPATVYIFFNPQEQVKSADPVTKDDNGNVIPLSERFKKKNDDIRYSLRGTYNKEGMSEKDVEIANKVISNLRWETMAARYGVVHTAAYTAERIERELNYSSATRPDYAKSYVAWVNPSDFVFATTVSDKNRENLKAEAGTLDVEKLSKESQPIYLIVDFESGRILGHEGRHRMLALEEAGIEKVAVIIDARNDDTYNTKPIERMRLEGQRFSDYEKGSNFSITSMLPLSARYADVAKEVFTQETESGIKYQEREEDLSERGILAKALESAAQGDIEAKNLKNYKKHLAEYDELNVQLHLMKVELDEARNAKDTAKVRELRDKITQTENRLAVFDKRLLKLEAAAPLKALVERERKNAVARADERLSKALESQKKKDAEKLDKALERAKESRQKTIDRLRESSKVKNQEMKRVLRESQEFARADGFLAGQMSQGREDAAKMRKMGEQYEAQIQKGKERLSEQKLMAEQKLLAQAERYRTSIKNATEGRHRTEIRNKIKRKIGQLNALLNGGKERHVPEAMRGAVASALDIINLDDQRYYTSRLNNLRDKLARATSSAEQKNIAFEIQKIELQQARFKDSIDELKASWEEIGQENDVLYDPLIAEKIDRVSLDIGKTLLHDMSMTQLEEIYDLYSMVLKRVQEANKLHDEQKKGEISELGKQAITEFNSMKQRNKIVSANKIDREKFSWNNEKPIYAFMRIGSKVLQERFEAIRNGEDTWARDISEAMDFFEKAKKQYNFKKWNRTKTFEFESSAGDKFSLDVEQMMSIYAYSKRKDADKHLMEGGFVFDPRTEIKKSKQGNKKLIQKHLEDATTYNISAETIQEIASKLTEEQRGYADTMQNYLSEVMGAKGNEVSMAMYDVKLFREKNYFPLKSSKLYRFETDNPAGEIKLKNSGFSKDRIPGANNPIVLTGFTDVWAGHVNDMSMYHAFVLPIDDFTRVYNYRTPIFPHQKSVKAELENVHGPAASAYIQKLLEDINGGARVDSTVGVWNRLVGRFKKASVMASLSVVIQQPSAIMRAFAEINPKYLIGLPKIPIIQHAKTWNEIKKYAPVAVIKDMGYFDTNMGLSTIDYIKGEKNAMEKIDDFFGKLPGYADESTWGAIWHMVKRETKAKHPSLKVSSDEFLELCGKRFTDIVVKTQVYDSVLSRSANMRSTDGLMKMATAFMAEPTTSINMLAQAVRDGKKHPGKSMAVAASVVSSVILNSALSSLVYAMRDEEEDETFWEKYVKNFSKEILDGFNILTYLPLYKDVWSIIQGWDIKRSDMDLVDKLYTKCMALSSLVFTDTEDMSEEEKKEYNKQLGWAIAETTGALGDLVGIPAKNLVREFKGAINTYNMWTRQHNEETKLVGTKLSMRHAFANGLIDILPEILLEPLDKFGIVKDRNVQDKIYEAVMAGDTEYLNRLKKDFDSDKAFDKQIRWALRNNDERLVEAVIARHEGRFKDYENLVKEMVADGFSKQNVITAVEAETFDMFPEETEETIEKIKGLYNADDFLVAYNKNNKTSMEVIKDDIIKTHVANGKTEDEAEAKFNSTIYSAVRERYEGGEINAATARKILENHSGRTEQNAKAAVTLWDYQAQYPDDDVEIYWINDYYEDIEASGVGLKTYVDYRNDAKLCKGKDANGDGKTDSGSVKKEKLLVIDALPISKEQKDAIYFSEGWAKSTLWEAPWR